MNPHALALDPKSSVSANSTTGAYNKENYTICTRICHLFFSALYHQITQLIHPDKRRGLSVSPLLNILRFVFDLPLLCFFPHSISGNDRCIQFIRRNITCEVVNGFAFCAGIFCNRSESLFIITREAEFLQSHR